jgi:toxin-antitoxin system PIN domain toxin
VIVVDVNLLLYAEVDAYPMHAPARQWWEDLLNGDRAVGLASVVVFGFLRISTNRKVFDSPLPIADAIDRVRRWFEQPSVTYLPTEARHLEIAFSLLEGLGTAGNITTDVQIAAHALEHRGEVHSNDSDFGRFEGLRWVNPLAG